MEIGDMIGIALSIILILSVLGLAVFLIYSAWSYFELKTVIDDCNKEFGEGNWVFIKYSNYYQCKSTTQRASISNSISQTCSINGVQINCSELDILK